MKLALILLLIACGDHASKLDESTPTITPLLSTPSAPPTSSAPRHEPIPRTTHLILCGEHAQLAGDDASGAVTHGTRSSCTVVFHTEGLRHCTIAGGTISDSNERMMTIQRMTGDRFTYRCGP